MNNEQFLLLQKAKESLKAANILLDNQLPDFASARAYYSRIQNLRVAECRIQTLPIYGF